MDKCELRKLINTLNKATKEYDEGHPSMTDKEWDDLYFKLVEGEKETGIIFPDSPTQSISYSVVNKLEKVTHEYPMLSLDKTKEPKEVASFVSGHEWCGMFKMDGLTCALTYVDGKLVGAETRGNGEIGENILHNALVVKNIPHNIPIKEKIIVNGEIICTFTDFEPFKEIYKNPRNFASGSIRLLDAKESASRNLSFIAWDLVQGCEDIDFFFWRLEKLDNWGFTTVPRVGDAETVEDAIQILNEMRDGVDAYKNSEYKNYPIDGYVFKFESVKYGKSLGRTAHHWNNALAFKFYDEEYETELLDIDWGMSRNGQLTPVAVFKEIDMDGSVVSRASLHNYSVLKETLGLYPDKNQPIWVVKSNEIIPQISRAIKNDIPHDHILSNGVCNICPICGHPTEIKVSESGVETVYCGNPSCEGKLQNRIDHYLGKKGLDVKGISKETIGKLIDWGWVSELKDIYNLEQYRRDWESRPGFGKTSVDKILSAINTEGRFVQLDAFISAIGIPLVGRTIAKEIVKYYDTWDDFRNAVGGDWTQFNGFGPEISRAINNFNYNEADKIAEILDFKIPEVQSSGAPAAAIKDKIFCVTGKLTSGQFKNRDELKVDIEKYGGKVTSSVSSKTNYLISNEASSSAKSVKAKELGVKVITEEEYLKMRT